MNTMKVLIGATFAVLVACLFFSYNQMQNDLQNDPATAEIEMLKKRLSQLEAADRGVYPSSNPVNNSSPAATTYQPTPSSPAVNPLEAQAAEMAKNKEMEELKKKLAALQSKTEKAERKADLADKEAGALAKEMTDRRQPETARANNIVQALLMARVRDWNAEHQLLEIQVERPEDVHTGLTLAIRRNSGIIGRVKVGLIEGSKGVADPIPGSFIGSEIDIREGDELIVPPAY